MTQPVLPINSHLSIPLSEIVFRFSRSSGPGGQNVNRTASRVELLYDVAGSPSLTDDQRILLQERLAGLLDSAGTLRLISQDTPSQWRNRQQVLERFQGLLARALRPATKRAATAPPRASRQARLEAKRRRSAAKRHRRPPRRDEW